MNSSCEIYCIAKWFACLYISLIFSSLYESMIIDRIFWYSVYYSICSKHVSSLILYFRTHLGIRQGLDRNAQHLHETTEGHGCNGPHCIRPGYLVIHWLNTASHDSEHLYITWPARLFWCLILYRQNQIVVPSFIRRVKKRMILYPS